jgi:hypothetical protein
MGRLPADFVTYSGDDETAARRTPQCRGEFAGDSLQLDERPIAAVQPHFGDNCAESRFEIHVRNHLGWRRADIDTYNSPTMRRYMYALREGNCAGAAFWRPRIERAAGPAYLSRSQMRSPPTSAQAIWSPGPATTEGLEQSLDLIAARLDRRPRLRQSSQGGYNVHVSK